MPAPAHTAVAKCAQCGEIFKLTLTGLLHKHGHGHGRQPCAGSGKPPDPSCSPSHQKPVDLLNAGFATSPDGASLQEQPFSFDAPPAGLLKRIPRAARLRASTAFEKCIAELNADPSDRLHWKKLLEFASCFAQPARAGKHHNLTNYVLKRLNRWEQGQSLPDDDSIRSQRRQQKRSTESQGQEAARRASIKLSAGDVRAAVRALCSQEIHADTDQATHKLLLSKHPPAPLNRRLVSPPPDSVPLIIGASEIRNAIKSFSPASSGGMDGLRPQHLLDMEMASQDSFIPALVDFTNLVLAGGVPADVRPIFFGASLHALKKKEGGIRPIAVGLTLRRLISKVANTWATSVCSSTLLPHQLGVGAKGGAEAIAHAARQMLSSMKSNMVFVKLDFVNAFNTLRRDSMMEAVIAHIPQLAHYINSSYGSSSTLRFGTMTVDSSEGVQQGDPLGPLLFSLTLNDILHDIDCSFVSGYLDDVAVAGDRHEVATEILRFEQRARALGLSLNHSKCQVIGLSPSDHADWVSRGLNFAVCDGAHATLLGAPLQREGLDEVLATHCSTLSLAVSRLRHLSSHEALYLLKHSLATPNLQYVLRTSPAFSSSELDNYDRILFDAIENINNITLEPSSLMQACLPVRWGGLGIRSAVALAPCAFLASIFASQALVQQILPICFYEVTTP